MPYIKQERRAELNGIVADMERRKVEPNGDLNYLLFKFCHRTVKPSYNNYKNFIAELNECVAEIRRRFLAPYEDQKIKENGDVT
jgi:hypothetical protein